MQPKEKESNGDTFGSRLQIENANLAEATKVIVENHYLQRGRTMAQMPYWINFDSKRVGVLLFALPRMSAKTEKYGYRSPMELIELARLWIHPEIQNTYVLDSKGKRHSLPIASMAISKSLKVIRQDWNSKYPKLPKVTACVAWSDDSLHEGTIYRASNFNFVGKSGGTMHSSSKRKNGGRDQLNLDYLHKKSAFLFEFNNSESK